MPIPVTCPSCQTRLKAPDAAAGRTTRCPSCGEPVTVVAASAERPAADAPAPRPGRGASAARPAESAPNGPRRVNLVVVAAAVGGLVLGIGAALLATAIASRHGRAATDSLAEASQAPAKAPGQPAPDGTFAGQDRNGDARLNVDELPEASRGRFAAIDGDGDGYVSRAEWDRAEAAAPAGEPARGKTMARAVFTSADDFLVDVWQNGKKVADDRRKVVGENFGATSEKLEIEIKEGDWLVFNVANNRLRWGGASYFGAAGVDESGKIVFESAPGDGHWSHCDDPGEVPAFIARPGYRADRAALPPANPWGGGDGWMKAGVADWSGKPVWGRERTTWIKYVAPAPGTWKPIARPTSAPAPPPAAAKAAEPKAVEPTTAEPAKPAVRLVARATLTGHPALVQCLVVTGDGKSAISGSSSNFDLKTNTMNSDTVLVWDLQGAAERRAVIRVGQTVASVAPTPDGRAVVVPELNRFDAYTLADGRKLASLAGPERNNAWAAAVSPDGKTVAGSFTKADVVLWSVATRKALRTFRAGAKGAGRLAFSPDGKQLAAGTFDGVVLTWDLATGRVLATIGTPDPGGSPVTALTYTPDGKSIAAVVAGKDPTLWDPASGARQRAIGEKESLAHHGLAFSADGKRAATTAVDPHGGKIANVVALWDTETGALLAKVEDTDGPTRGVAFTPDGRTLLSTGGNTVKLWEIAEGP